MDIRQIDPRQTPLPPEWAALLAKTGLHPEDTPETTVLVWDGGKELQKRIVVGNGFLPTDPHNWEQEWNEAGISSYAKEHLDWYEQKMKKILKSMKKNQDIIG